jgi:hypothetical protein
MSGKEEDEAEDEDDHAILDRREFRLTHRATAGKAKLRVGHNPHGAGA